MENSKINLKDLLGNLGTLSEVSEADLLFTVNKVMNPILVSKYGDTSNIEIIANKRGDFEITKNYKVVNPDEVRNPNKQISVDDERLKDDDFEVGEEYCEFIDLTEFSNSEILKIKQSLNNEVVKLTNNYIKKTYGSLEGKLVDLLVVEMTKNGYILLDEHFNLKFELNNKNTLHSDIINVGDIVLALVEEVGVLGKATRTSELFMKELLELKLRSDLNFNLVKMARIKGVRTKYVIKGKFNKDTYDILKYAAESISEEINGEIVDIIIYSVDRTKYLRNCFYNIWILDAWYVDDQAYVLVEPNQIPFVLGKKGTNMKLTNDVLDTNVQMLVSKMPKNEDIELIEYWDDDTKYLIDHLMKLNIDTARGFMRYSREKLPNKFKDIATQLANQIHSDFLEE